MDAIAERLRDFVRARVRKDGRYYEVGAQKRLAVQIGRSTGWVSEYVSEEPARNASIDDAFAICAAFGVELAAFAGEVSDTFAAPDPPKYPKAVTRSVRLLLRMSDAGQREAADLLAGLARAYPRGEAAGRTEPPVETTSVKGRKLSGTR